MASIKTEYGRALLQCYRQRRPLSLLLTRATLNMPCRLVPLSPSDREAVHVAGKHAYRESLRTDVVGTPWAASEYRQRLALRDTVWLAGWSDHD